MKRICFLVDSIFSIGGVQRVTAVIAKELAKTYDVTIVTFDDPKAKDLSLYELHELAPIIIRYVKHIVAFTKNIVHNQDGPQTSMHVVLFQLL